MKQFLPFLLSAPSMKVISVNTLPNTTFEVKRKTNTPSIKLDNTLKWTNKQKYKGLNIHHTQLKGRQQFARLIRLPCSKYSP